MSLNLSLQIFPVGIAVTLGEIGGAQQLYLGGVDDARGELLAGIFAFCFDSYSKVSHLDS